MKGKVELSQFFGEGVNVHIFIFVHVFIIGPNGVDGRGGRRNAGVDLSGGRRDPVAIVQGKLCIRRDAMLCIKNNKWHSTLEKYGQ